MYSEPFENVSEPFEKAVETWGIKMRLDQWSSIETRLVWFGLGYV